MGDTSIIARRLSDRHVQYGWSGNGGYFSTVGNRLLEWYDDPDMVEYLFGLGQLRHLWAPHSEGSDSRFRTIPDGVPHWVGSSEQQIFDRIAFVDYGYLYDSDHTWYYVTPDPVHLKIPLKLVARNLDDRQQEYSFLDQMRRQVLSKMLDMCRHDPDIRQRLAGAGYDHEEVIRVAERDLVETIGPVETVWQTHRLIYDIFDDWVVIQADEGGAKVGDILLRPRGETHVETICW